METAKMLDAPYRAAVVLLVEAPWSVWLAQRAATCAVMPNQWECPAGKLEPKEDYEEGALRELKEETGLVITSGRLEPCGLVRTRGAGAMNCACALFMVRLKDGDGMPRDTEPHKRGKWLEFSFPGALELDSTIGTQTLLGILAEDYEMPRSCLPSKVATLSAAIKEIGDRVKPEKDCIICDFSDAPCAACMERARITGMVNAILKRVL